MNRLNVLRDKRAARLADSKAILAKADAEGRTGELTDQEKADLEKNEADIKSLDADIAREERLAEYERTQAKTVPDHNAKAEEAAKKKEEEKKTPAYPASFVRHRQLTGFANNEDGYKKAYASGQWLLANVFGSQPARQWCADHADAIWSDPKAAQTGTTNTGGGILVPEILESAIIDLRETYGVFRQNVNPLAMGSDTVTWPRRRTGLSAYFVADTDATTESEKSWDGVTLNAKELASLVRYPRNLGDDAIINMADDLASEIAYAFALKEDQCGFLGDGTSTYGGIRGVAVKINDGNYAGSIATAASGHTAFSSLDIADFTLVTAKLPVYAQTMAKWYISNAGFANSMQRLMYVAGGNTTEQIPGSTRQSFLGYPVVISQVLNSTLGADTSAIKCLFGALPLGCKMGVRRGITIQTSDQRYFEYGHIGIRGTERFDIVVHDLGDGTNAGPIVALKTPAS